MRTRRMIAALDFTTMAMATAGLVLGAAPQSQASASLACPDHETYCTVLQYNTVPSTGAFPQVGSPHAFLRFKGYFDTP
ncbi:hypothetical protein [Streptomyces sp. NPDC058751]|uniref:hypothetical protein n=1 Tax=Streptomyces sp. NPDC058751 TaxID=3346623 RepID=UPI0036A40CCD